MRSLLGRTGAAPGRIAAWMAFGLALLLSSCTQQQTGIPQSPLLRYLERRTGRIAYAGADGNLWTIDQAGQGASQLTSDASVQSGAAVLHYYQFPTWSPDGKRIAVMSLTGTSSQIQNAGLVAVTADGAHRVELYSSQTEAPQSFAWSPDSRRIAFLTTGSAGINAVLRVVSAEGGQARTVDAGNSLGYQWWPGGRSILVHATRASPQRSADRLALLYLDGEVIESGLPIPPGVYQVAQALPDGKRLLACQLTNDTNELVLADSSGAILGTLAKDPGGIGFVPSPDGRLVVVGTSEGSNGSGVRLAVVDVRAGNQTSARPLTSVSESGIVGFFWSPDSSQVAYFVPSTQGQGSQQTLLLTLKVLDVRRRAAHTLRTFQPSPQFVELVQHFEQLAKTTRIWSPDSKNILYCAVDNQGPGLWVEPAAGIIQPRRIADGFIASWSWR